MLIVFYSLTKEKKENNAIKHFYSNMEMSSMISLFHDSIKLIPDGLAVSRRRTRPTSIHVGRSVCLSE